MSRDPYRSSEGDLGLAYGELPGPARGGGQRWDSDRLAYERDRARELRDRERELAFRPRQRAYEEDRYHGDTRYYNDAPVREREPDVTRTSGRAAITIEKEREREYYREPSPPPLSRGGNRPAFLRRQSSLDTFDRRPVSRFEREEYGPPARREDLRVNVNINEPRGPLPVRRALGPPPRRYEDDYDDDYRYPPERVLREREIIRTRRRSRSRSSSSSSSGRSARTSRRSETKVTEVIKEEFPKRGKTRIPARLVHKSAITALGYPFEEEGDIIIIQKALGRENIDEVIKLSAEWKVERIDPVEGPIAEEVITKTTTIVDRVPSPPSTHHTHRSRSEGPRNIETDIRRTEIVEQPGALALIVPERRKDERAIRAEIKALEAEKEALRAERRAEKELRRADRIRYEGQSGGALILYDEDDRRVSRRESRREERKDEVRVEKDRKERALGLLLKTLT